MGITGTDVSKEAADMVLADAIGLTAAGGGGVVLPLLAMHLLWITPVTDGAPALALGVDPADPRVMNEPPRPPAEGVITRRMWVGILFVGAIMAAGTLLVLDHTKTISVDGEICSIGSANIDIRSFSINYEINAVLYNERLAKELEQAFERDLVHCTEFDVAEYEERKATLRFRDSVARLFTPLL